MSLPPLATKEDLLTALGRTVDDASATLALRRASARVRKYAQQDFTVATGDTITLPGNVRTLLLPQRPLIVDGAHPLTVTELIGVTGYEYTCIEGRDYTRLGSNLTRGDQVWAPTRLMGWPHVRPTGVWAERVRITYSHGYPETPDDVEDIVLDLAVMNLSNPQNLRSETIDDYSRTFAAETIGNARLSAEHKADLKPYRAGAFSVAPSR
ncbi:hypothetical protein [Kitasatospora cineracea]|uniref:Uncharacterized protein n=1 Tax=Kitasatospora cineracea TaxID=88074 RepID=A0A3N4R8J1_9ACTN|nr:hypothetical protein [Kitasatospora cineracea]RPE27285.1 hypothetical protein EDD38_7430 [Kitasatospora cineracea]